MKGISNCPVCVCVCVWPLVVQLLCLMSNQDVLTTSISLRAALAPTEAEADTPTHTT